MHRKALPSDFDFFYALYMHPAVNPYLLYEWMDATAFQPIYEDLLRQGVLYVYQHEGVPAGMFKLVRLLHRTAHVAYMGGVAVDPQFAGQGLGAKLIQEVLDLGKTLGLRRIELSAALNNERAIRLYEKMGFEKEGILRQYTWLISENRFLDEVLMSFLYEGNV